MKTFNTYILEKLIINNSNRIELLLDDLVDEYVNKYEGTRITWVINVKEYLQFFIKTTCKRCNIDMNVEDINNVIDKLASHVNTKTALVYLYWTAPNRPPLVSDSIIKFIDKCDTYDGWVNVFTQQDYKIYYADGDNYSIVVAGNKKIKHVIISKMK